MSHDPRQPIAASAGDPSAGDPGADKFEQHHRQQLSALVDGELSPDEARFLLRRLEHDGELAGRLERWQLCGDVLRGQVRRAVDPDFSRRVAAAIAAAPAVEVGRPKAANAGRSPAWMRWGGGGAALAASVAVVAMLVGHPAAPDASTVPTLAQQQALPATEAVLAAAAPSGGAASATQGVAIADVGAAPARAVARPALVRRAHAAPAPAGAVPPDVSTQVATAQLAHPGIAQPAAADPFASATPLHARPWPRATLPQAAGSAYTASFGMHGQEPQEQARTFYPFDPHQQPVPPAGPDGSNLPLPPDAD